jgi:hypothetical protein
MFPERGYTDTEMPGNGISPVFLFQGDLEIDGVPIRPDSTVREINKKLKNITPFHCMTGMNLCDTAIENNGVILYIFIGTDRRKYDGTIYSVEASDDTN